MREPSSDSRDLMEPAAPEAGARGRFETTLANDLGDLRRANLALEEFLGQTGLPPRTTASVGLVVEELVSNVIRHGFADTDLHEISLEVAIDAGRVTIRIEDDGIEFDPTRHTSAKREPTSVLDLDVGGRGIVLVRKRARALRYRRVGDRNVLTAEVPISA